MFFHFIRLRHLRCFSPTAGRRFQSTTAKKQVVGRVSQVIGAVVDVEFDSVDDIPDILNALKIKVNAEKYNKVNDTIRTASLLPKQIREAKARKAKLVEAEKDWIATGSTKKVAAETVQYLRDAGAMDEIALKRLEASLATREAGLGPAIRQVRRCRSSVGLHGRQ